MAQYNYALTEEEALELLAFLTTSAQGCFKEPPMYGIYRLVSAALKLAEKWQPRASDEFADFLEELNARGYEQANILGNDPQDFKSYLVEINTSLARVIKSLPPKGARS